MHVRPRVQGLALRQTPQGVEEAFFSISSRGRFFERPHRDDLWRRSQENVHEPCEEQE